LTGIVQIVGSSASQKHQKNNGEKDQYHNQI